MSNYIILAGFVSFVFLSCIHTVEPEIFIIPKGYTGYLIVVFNQSSGLPIRYEGKKRVYDIPENGILKTQFSLPKGWSSSIEFFYGEVSSNTQLPTIMDYHKIPNDTIVGWIGSMGSIKKNENSDDRLEYMISYIGTKNDILQAIKQADSIDKSQLGNY